MSISSIFYSAVAYLAMALVPFSANAQTSCVLPAALQSFTAQCDAFGVSRTNDMASCLSCCGAQSCGSIGVLAEVRRESQRLVCSLGRK